MEFPAASVLSNLTAGTSRERLSSTAAAGTIRRAAGRRSGAAARGKSRPDELAAGHGGISSRGVSGAGEAAAFAAAAQEFLAPDSGVARSRFRARSQHKF